MPSDAAIYLSVEREWVESGDISTVLHAPETMESGLQGEREELRHLLYPRLRL